MKKLVKTVLGCGSGHITAVRCFPLSSMINLHVFIHFDHFRRIRNTFLLFSHDESSCISVRLFHLVLGFFVVPSTSFANYSQENEKWPLANMVATFFVVDKQGF